MAEIPMSAPLVNLFSVLVEDRTGIHYGPDDHDLFASKVRGRALESGYESPLDYYYRLRYDDPDRREFDALVETLVIHETYFFREVEPMRVARDAFLLPAVAAGKKPRVWCAASSSGEEPFTLAMLLEEKGALGQVEIVASDISQRVLDRAREGVCSGRSLRSTSDEARARWFKDEDGRPRVLPRIARSVTWHRVNLVDPSDVAPLGEFDLILCRNVLIYFSDDVVRRVADTLTRALTPGGRLLVGVSESLLRYGTALACEERSGSFFYEKAP